MSDEPRASSMLQPPTLAPNVVAALLWLTAGSGVGYVGHNLQTDDQQPAVLAQAVDRLREDVRDLAVELRQLQHSAAANKWDKTDHSDWVRSVYAPATTQLTQRIERLESKQ